MALRATAVITNDNDQPSMSKVKPDSIVDIEDKTYINLRPLTGLPSFPVTFAPAGMDLDAFLPIDPDAAFAQGYADGMATGWPHHTTPSTAATEQVQHWLQNCCTTKRPAEEEPSRPQPKRPLTRRSIGTTTDGHRLNEPDGPSTRHIRTNNRRDVATDAYELLQHSAQYEKAALIVRCCPILGLDIHGPTPDDEDPRWFYLVIQNLRASCITTRELLLALLDRFGEPAELTFTRTGRDTYSAFLAYRSISQL